MSAVFESARFCRLFRSHWVENRRSYAWFTAIAMIIDLIIIAVIFMADNGRRGGAFYFDTQVGWFVAGFFLTGIIFTVRYWALLNHPGACLIALMRPASIFEKWLLSLLWIVFIFPLAYTAFYILLHWPSVQLAQWLYQSVPAHLNSGSSFYPNFNFYIPLISDDNGFQSPDKKSNDFFLSEVFVFLIWSGLLAFCAGFKVFFKKSSTLKMVILGFVIFIITIALSAILDVSFFKAVAYWKDTKIAGWQPDVSAEMLANIILIGVPFLMWVALYFHIQEREVS